eukprot:scaffold323089_cov37-Tisochrysis_lutea.AAC.3
MGEMVTPSGLSAVRPTRGKRVPPPSSGVLRYMKNVSTRGPCGVQVAVFWSWCTCSPSGQGISV